MNQELRDLLDDMRRQVTRIADSLEIKPISYRAQLQADLNWLEWCYLSLPSEGLKRDIEEMAAELKKLEDDERS